MSKYTTEVRFICETVSGLSESQGYNNVEEIIGNARKKIFDFNYPIFDENYRSVIETKILKHFYTREIGAETYGLWKLWLNERMNLIMPYYNKLYQSELLTFNPFNDVDITTQHEGAIQSNTTETSNTDVNTSNNYNDNSNTWDLYSDTPQGDLNGFPNNNNDKTYLTNATHDITTKTGNNNGNSTTDTRGNGTANTTDEYFERITGKRNGYSYSKLLQEYRDTFINIDLQVINELNDLFLNLW